MKKVMNYIPSALAAALALVVGYMGGYNNQPAPRVSVRTIEIPKTVPDAGSTLQRLSIIEGKLDQVIADQAARKSKKTVTAKAK